MNSVRGYVIDVNDCPTCDQPYHSQERRPDGYRACKAGHKWKARQTVTIPGPPINTHIKGEPR